MGCFGLSGGELGVALSLLEAALTGTGGREGSSGQGWELIKPGEREHFLILTFTTQFPQGGGEMLGHFLYFQNPIEVEVHKLFKKTTCLKYYLPASTEGSWGQEKKTSVGGRVESILSEKCQQALLEAKTSSTDCVCTKQAFLPYIEYWFCFSTFRSPTFPTRKTNKTP